MTLTLNLSDLREILDEAGVPHRAYALRHGLGVLRRRREGVWCLARTGGEWQVYQWLGGAKRHLTTTSTEESACDVLLGELGFGYLVPGLRPPPSGAPPE